MYQMYKHCKCGGYVEIAEHSLESLYCDDGTMPPDSVLNKYMATLATSLEKMGVSPHHKLADYKRMLTAAGFVDIQAYGKIVNSLMGRSTTIDLPDYSV